MRLYNFLAATSLVLVCTVLSAQVREDYVQFHDPFFTDISKTVCIANIPDIPCRNQTVFDDFVVGHSVHLSESSEDEAIILSLIRQHPKFKDIEEVRQMTLNINPDDECFIDPGELDETIIDLKVDADNGIIGCGVFTQCYSIATGSKQGCFVAAERVVWPFYFRYDMCSGDFYFARLTNNFQPCPTMFTPLPHGADPVDIELLDGSVEDEFFVIALQAPFEGGVIKVHRDTGEIAESKSFDLIPTGATQFRITDLEVGKVAGVERIFALGEVDDSSGDPRAYVLRLDSNLDVQESKRLFSKLDNDLGGTVARSLSYDSIHECLLATVQPRIQPIPFNQFFAVLIDDPLDLNVAWSRNYSLQNGFSLRSLYGAVYVPADDSFALQFFAFGREFVGGDIAPLFSDGYNMLMNVDRVMGEVKNVVAIEEPFEDDSITGFPTARNTRSLNNTLAFKPETGFLGVATHQHLLSPSGRNANLFVVEGSIPTDSVEGCSYEIFHLSELAGAHVDSSFTCSDLEIGIVDELKLNPADRIFPVLTQPITVAFDRICCPLESAVDTVQVFRGVQKSGFGKNSLFNVSDDEYVTFNPGFTLNDKEAPVWLEFERNLGDPQDVDYLRIQLESNAGTPGLTKTTEVWNWTTGSYDLVDQSAETFGNDSTVSADLTPLIADYVSPKGVVRFRTGWRQTGFIINFPWVISVDKATIKSTSCNN